MVVKLSDEEKAATTRADSVNRILPIFNTDQPRAST